MVFEYENRVEDYLDALALQKANGRENRGLIHLIFFVGVGCLVYLNLCTLRFSFRWEDPLAYDLGLLTTALLFIQYSPKLLPALRLRWAREGIPGNVLGRHKLEVTKKYLSFSAPGTELRVGYEGLARVNHNDRTVLFYLLSGSIEAVPLRALGCGAAERTKVLETIQSYALKANRQDRMEELPPWLEAPEGSFTCRITREAVLDCTRADVSASRRRSLRDPFHWFYLILILLCAVGGVYGLCHLGQYPLSLRGYLRILYVAEPIAAVVALLYWWRPAAMVVLAARQNLRLGYYPAGYLGCRKVEWDGKSLAFRYGVFGLRLDWSQISAWRDDGTYLRLYQENTMVLFLPKAETDPGLLEKIAALN